jgi:glycosyltransferase involved in cell wall biosynthesis
VIPNGFPIPAEDSPRANRASLCDELGVPMESPLVGLIARLHPMKDHATFLRAAAIVARAVPQTHFVLAGRDVPGSRELRDQITALQLQDCVHLLPERHDVPRLLTAFDIAVSSSYSEAFPNIVGEALAGGTLTIATDAGDSAALIGDARWVVPVRDPNALAAAIADGLALAPDERREIGERGRARIMNLYSIERAAERFRDVYVALRKPRAASPMPCAG